VVRRPARARGDEAAQRRRRSPAAERRVSGGWIVSEADRHSGRPDFVVSSSGARLFRTFSTRRAVDGGGMLQELGISEFEEQVYRRLLGEPEMTVPALAAALSTSPRRVRAATSRLCTLGLATRTEAGGYAPVSPDAAIDALIHQREAELDRVRAAKRELLDEFRTGHLKRQPSGLLEVVSGREAIHRRPVEARLGARYEVLSFDQPPYAAPEDYDEVANEHPVLARGVTYHVIYTPESLQLPGRVRAITELGRAGEQARLLPSLPIKLHIYDRS